jgi:hypothetical protein
MVRSRVLAWQLQLTALVGVVGAAVAGCGDPVLPSDYVGPPASTTTGKVLTLGAAREAARPRLSVEWLSRLNGAPGESTLEGQPLRFTRSVTLQSDWDIGLELPVDGAVMDLSKAATPVTGLRFAVGKMVYFDDRDGDGRLNWNCQVGTCDLAKAVSHEYVVYVEGTRACRNATTTQGSLNNAARPTAGFSYFSFEGSVPSKLDGREPLQFFLADQSLLQWNPSDDLRKFAKALILLWSLGSLSSGC